MDFLKDILGDELFSEVTKKLKDNDAVQLVNLNEGNYLKREVVSKDLEELKSSNGDLQRKMKDLVIEKALILAGAKNVSAVKGLMNFDAIEFGDEGVRGIDVQVKSLKESDSYLFENGLEFNTHGGNPAARGSILDYDSMSDEELFDVRMR